VCWEERCGSFFFFLSTIILKHKLYLTKNNNKKIHVFIWISLKKSTTLLSQTHTNDLFGIVIAVAVQSAFYVKIHQDDVFLFFLKLFLKSVSKRSKNIKK
jgi:hypothetical protein